MTQTADASAPKTKLIEVALPLEAINAACAKDALNRHKHPSTLHLWWSRKPLGACRAVLFAQLVDDPSAHPEEFPTEEAQEEERQRLFRIIEELVVWKNSTNEEVLERARAEIRRSCGGVMPPVYDPFSGGGSIPLEAQRLGLPAHGSDLNPVAVMIGKAMIEIPPRFKDNPPVHPGGPERNHYRNAEGLAEDVRHYGAWMREKAKERIGHLYPTVMVPASDGPNGRVAEREATVIAWIWARMVPSPDPALGGALVPLVSSFLLSSKKGKEAWVEPVVDRAARTISYRVHHGGTAAEFAVAKTGTKTGRGANFRCLLSGATIEPRYIKDAGKAGRMEHALIAIVAESEGGRAYVAPSNMHEATARSAKPKWKPDIRFEPNALGFRIGNYGMKTFGDLFTDRQLVALTTFSGLVHEARETIERDALATGLAEDSVPLCSGGTGAKAYAEAVSVYLGLSLDRFADYWTTLGRWQAQNQQLANLFGRHAIPMVWEYPEANPFSGRGGSADNLMHWSFQSIEQFPSNVVGTLKTADASVITIQSGAAISTDPPYYDNIGYADLSDFFFSWVKPTVGPVYPELFGLLAVPKTDEILAARHRHGNDAEAAEAFFMAGMKRAIANMAQQASSDYPTTIYYAFKQSEIEKEGIASTGWATFLQAVLDSGFAVLATWPMRTEMANRMRGIGSNALANSVVLVCRRRPDDAPSLTRSQFVRALRRELPAALTELQKASIAPTDLPQSAIGPGMGIFSRHAAVLEADDTPMSVKTALQLINHQLDEYLNETQGEFDADTRFAISWFEANGFGQGDYGTANSIAQARGVSVESVRHAGIVEAGGGKVRILKRDEIDPGWAPETDDHVTVWECCQHTIRALDDGMEAAARLVRRMGPDMADRAKDLAYCLHDICSNKRKDAKEATAYNALIADWPELTRMAATIPVEDAAGQQSFEGV